MEIRSKKGLFSIFPLVHNVEVKMNKNKQTGALVQITGAASSDKADGPQEEFRLGGMM